MLLETPADRSHAIAISATVPDLLAQQSIGINALSWRKDRLIVS
jgi:hypothetical protein